MVRVYGFVDYHLFVFYIYKQIEFSNYCISSNSSRGSINFTLCVMRGQFEGALYSRARFNSTDHAAKLRHIVKLDRKILMQEVL